MFVTSYPLSLFHHNTHIFFTWKYLLYSLIFQTRSCGGRVEASLLWLVACECQRLLFPLLKRCLKSDTTIKFFIPLASHFFRLRQSLWLKVGYSASTLPSQKVGLPFCSNNKTSLGFQSTNPINNDLLLQRFFTLFFLV